MWRLVVVLGLLLPGGVGAEEQVQTWAEQKCSAYRTAWERALSAYDNTQMNYGFIAANENFIAAGCTGAPSACPRSSVELEVANALTLAMMNAGTASTFLPFRCPHEPTEGGWTGPGL